MPADASHLSHLSHLSLSPTEGSMKKEVKSKDIKKKGPGKKGPKVGGWSPGAPCSLGLSSGRLTRSAEAQLVAPGVDTSVCVAEHRDQGRPTRMHPHRLGHYQVYPLRGGCSRPPGLCFGSCLPLTQTQLSWTLTRRPRAKVRTSHGLLAERPRPPRPCASCSHGYVEIASSSLGVLGLNTS